MDDLKNEINRLVELQNERNRRTITLFGGFTCRLSSEETNQWHEYYHGLIECKDIESLRIKLDMLTATQLTTPDDRVEYIHACETLDKLTHKMYEVGKQWYTNLRKGTQ